MISCCIKSLNINHYFKTMAFLLTIPNVLSVAVKLRRYVYVQVCMYVCNVWLGQSAGESEYIVKRSLSQVSDNLFMNKY